MARMQPYTNSLAMWKQTGFPAAANPLEVRLQAQATAAHVGLYEYTLHLPTPSIFYLTANPVGYLSTEGCIMLCKSFFTGQKHNKNHYDTFLQR